MRKLSDCKQKVIRSSSSSHPATLNGALLKALASGAPERAGACPEPGPGSRGGCTAPARRALPACVSGARGRPGASLAPPSTATEATWMTLGCSCTRAAIPWPSSACSPRAEPGRESPALEPCTGAGQLQLHPFHPALQGEQQQSHGVCDAFQHMEMEETLQPAQWLKNQVTGCLLYFYGKYFCTCEQTVRCTA